MEIFTNLPLHDLVLLARQVLSCVVEVKFVVGGVGTDDLCFLHMKGNRQDSRQSKVGVLNVISVHFLVDVQEVGILEFLNWLVGYFTGPVVHADAAILQNHLLQVIEFIPTIIISLNWLQQLSDVLAFVHYLLRGMHIHQGDHDFCSGALLNS